MRTLRKKAISFMHGRENFIEPEHAPHTPIALFDEYGKLHGWSPTFSADCAQSSIEFRRRMVCDFWPEFDADRWAEIWRTTQAERSATVVQVLARNKQSDHSELVELEIGRFVVQEISLAKIEVRRAATRRMRLLQQEILETMANGVPLNGIMDTLCRRVEALAPSVTCSVVAINRQQQLCHIASPSLPLH
jgi:hypothetical protein